MAQSKLARCTCFMDQSLALVLKWSSEGITKVKSAVKLCSARVLGKPVFHESALECMLLCNRCEGAAPALLSGTWETPDDQEHLELVASFIQTDITRQLSCPFCSRALAFVSITQRLQDRWDIDLFLVTDNAHKPRIGGLSGYQMTFVCNCPECNKSKTIIWRC